jgi:hypothetical protein
LRPSCFAAGHRKSRARISRRRYDFGSAARVALECRHYLALEITQRSHSCIGSVAHLQARQGIIDRERLRVNLDAYKPVARLFGNLDARLGEKFTLKRQSFAEWPTENGADAAAERAEAWS